MAVGADHDALVAFLKYSLPRFAAYRTCVDVKLFCLWEDVVKIKLGLVILLVTDGTMLAPLFDQLLFCFPSLLSQSLHWSPSVAQFSDRIPDSPLGR